MELCLNTENGIEYMEDRAMIKAAVTYWKKCHFPVLFELSECSHSQWVTSRNKVLENIEISTIPNESIGRLNVFIEIIGKEIFFFTDYIKRILRERHYLGYTPVILNLILSKLFWSEKGIIDRTETFRLFLVDENISPLFRFVIAAFFCFQDYLSMAWDQMSDNGKEILSTACDTSSQHWIDDLLTHCFIFKVKKETDLFGFDLENKSSEELLRYHRKQSVNNFNLQAFEFCFNKSAIESRQEILCESLSIMKVRYLDIDNDGVENCIDKYRDTNDMLLFLSKHFNHEILEFLQIKKFDFNHLLYSLLRWPYQEKLLSTMQYLKNFLRTEHYSGIIEMLIVEIESGINDFDYVSLLSEVCEIPLQLEIEMDEFDIINAMIPLISYTNEKSLSLITTYMTLTAREKLMNDKKFIERCVVWSSPFEREYLNKLINICLPTVDKLKIYQSNCISFVNNHKDVFNVYNVSCIEDLKFFQFLNELISHRYEDVNVSNMEI